MATQSSKFGLVRLLLRAGKLRQQGFTLIELLIVVIIGSLIMGSLLYLVTELMQVNRREEVLTQTQQDMQRAMDYMTRDVREAVFVYSTPGAIVEPNGGTETLIDQLDGIPANAVPILAFWRLDPVDPNNNTFWSKNCSTAFSGAQTNECNTLKLRQSFYTLVVYFQQPNDPGDIWGGPSRIVRYELPKYSASDVATLTQRKGYSDPTGCATFANWGRPPGWDSTDPCDATNTGTTAPTIAVLTDYVNNADLGVSCAAGAIQTPATPNGLLACVSTGTAAAGDAGANQTLRLFLQGNATEGRPGIVNALSDSGGLPTLESEVLVRGVLNKQPSGVDP